MFLVRHTATGKFFRVVQHMSSSNLIPDADLKDNGLLGFPDLWAATQFIERNPIAKLPIELVEVEFKIVRTIPSVIDVKAEHEIQGDQLSITPIV